MAKPEVSEIRIRLRDFEINPAPDQRVCRFLWRGMGNLKKEERKRIEAEIWSRAQCDTRSSNIISDRHRVTQGRMQEQSSIRKDFSLTCNCTRSWPTGLFTFILQKRRNKLFIKLT